MNIFIVIVGLAALAECVTPKTTTTENYDWSVLNGLIRNLLKQTTPQPTTSTESVNTKLSQANDSEDESSTTNSYITDELIARVLNEPDPEATSSSPQLSSNPETSTPYLSKSPTTTRPTSSPLAVSPITKSHFTSSSNNGGVLFPLKSSFPQIESYYLPSSIKFQYSQPSVPQQHKLPSVPQNHDFLSFPQQHEFPPVAQQSEFPSVPKQHEFPLVSKQHESASFPQQHEFPPVAQQYEFPSVPQQSEFPSVPQQHEFPSVSQQHESPSFPQQHEFPPVAQQYESPSVPQQHEFPPVPQQHEFPSVSQQHESPSFPQQHEFPPVAQQHEFPPVAQQYEFSSVPQQHEFSSVSQQHVSPSFPQQHEFPSFAQQYEFPSISQQHKFPPVGEQYEFPTVSQQHEFPSVPQQYEFPSFPQQHEFPSVPQHESPLQFHYNPQEIPVPYKPSSFYNKPDWKSPVITSQNEFPYYPSSYIPKEKYPNSYQNSFIPVQPQSHLPEVHNGPVINYGSVPIAPLNKISDANSGTFQSLPFLNQPLQSYKTPGHIVSTFVRTYVPQNQFHPLQSHTSQPAVSLQTPGYVPQLSQEDIISLIQNSQDSSLSRDSTPFLNPSSFPVQNHSKQPNIASPSSNAGKVSKMYSLSPFKTSASLPHYKESRTSKNSGRSNPPISMFDTSQLPAYSNLHFI